MIRISVHLRVPTRAPSGVPAVRRSVEGGRPASRAPDRPVIVELMAEEVGDRPWSIAVVDRFVPYGDVFCRFVVRERGPGLRSRRPLYAGEPFPVARPGLADVGAQGAWRDVQVARLLEMQRRLTQDAWVPAGLGADWWSHRYTRGPLDRTSEDHPN